MTRPIGVFDSGVGGLSVAREIARLLPAEEILYVADTAYCPYGDRPAPEVRARALAVGRHLEEEGSKLVVAACNTASGAALEDLRAALRVPVVGLEPAVKTAAARTRNGRIGVMATSGTLASDRYARLVRDHARERQVVPLACPGLADLVEAGHLDDEALDSRLQALVAPLRAADVDTVVLGCTHYAFVEGPIRRALGPGVEIVDSGPAIARRADALLAEAACRANGGRRGGLRVRTTGDAREVARIVARIWPGPVPVEHVDV